ncbi:MAG: hypothetical protein V3U90_01290 [Dehalococcoidia bacterium]
MGPEELKKAIRRFKRPKKKASLSEINLSPESTFDALMEERLQQLERQIGEVRSRVNWLFLLIVGAATADIISRFTG